MKATQLRSLIKIIITEMIANKDVAPEPMAAVNVEATEQPDAHPWHEVDNGFFSISIQFASKLANGKLPGPGYEKLVAAPKGFDSKRGFVWLAQTIVGGKQIWSIRDARNWKLVNGLAILSSSDVTGVDESTPNKRPISSRQLSIPEKHQLRISLQTLRMNDVGADIMGGQTKEEAREFLKRMGYSDSQIARVEKPEMYEETSTGAVAGYSTPYAFSGKGKGSKDGSKKALDVTTKMGYKKVKSISEMRK